MNGRSFAKVLSANDLGRTGSHQAGILVPKTDSELLGFFPPLDPEKLNPDAWISCEDNDGEIWKLRYVYYNNRLHVDDGTRNEYRLTYLTKFLRRSGARVGDSLVFTATGTPSHYRLTVSPVAAGKKESPEAPAGVIQLRGWRRVH